MVVRRLSTQQEPDNPETAIKDKSLEFEVPPVKNNDETLEIST